MTFANNLDPDEAQQNVRLYLRSKLFDIQIIYQQNKWVETMNVFENFERNKYLKNLPSMQRAKTSFIYTFNEPSQLNRTFETSCLLFGSEDTRTRIYL